MPNIKNYFSKLIPSTENEPLFQNIQLVEIKKIVLFLFTIVSIIGLIILSVLLNPISDASNITIIVLSILCDFLIIFMISKNQNIELVSIIFVISFGLQLLYLFYFIGFTDINYVWVLLFPMSCYFFLRTVKGTIASLLFLFVFVLIYFTQNIIFQHEYSFILKFILAYGAVMFLSMEYENIKTKLNLLLESKNKELKSNSRIIREKDRQLLKAKNNAEKSEKMKYEFIAQISHEIRTPVNTILNNIWLLKDELKEKFDEEDELLYASINNASSRLVRTIDLILDYSSVELGFMEMHFENVNLSDVILSKIKNEFSIAARLKGLTLKINNTVEHEVPIYVDVYSFTQIIANLVDNAIKYTMKGYIFIDVNFTKSNCKIKIIDTGIGIADEYLPILFDAFTQETVGYTRKFEGNGLGLALVKKYCELNKVQIEVQSTKGKGTVFTLTLDLSPNN